MKIKKKYKIFVYGLVVLFATSCGGLESGLKAKSKIVPVEPSALNDPISTETEEPTGVDDSELIIVEVPLSFETIKTQILDDHCINCHIGKHSVFELHSLVQIYADDILQRMTTTNVLKRMPPSKPPISPELIDLFRAWVEIGTPEFEENLVYPMDQKFLKKQKQ